MSEPKYQIDFALIATVQGMHFEPHRPDGIEFKVENDRNLRICLVPSDPEEDACGSRLGLVCKVCATFAASELQFRFAEGYNQNVMTDVAADVKLPYQINGRTVISDDGRFATTDHPGRYLCPEEIQNLLESVDTELASKMDRFLYLLRWRQDFDSESRVVNNRSLYWRTKEGDYPIAPMEGGPRTVTMPCMLGLHWGDDYESELGELWSTDGLIEPLGHTLLHEAGSLAEASPRSAILILTAAIETAVKMHLSTAAPDTAWLMEEIQSPPVFKILRDYIPSVHKGRGVDMSFWVKLLPLFKETQKLIEIRNKVAHTGCIPVTTSPIRDYLELASDILYILDVLDGHEWAKQRVSHPIRKQLGWPNPNNARMCMTITTAG
jgi:hypothetical protein